MKARTPFSTVEDLQIETGLPGALREIYPLRENPFDRFVAEVAKHYGLISRANSTDLWVYVPDALYLALRGFNHWGAGWHATPFVLDTDSANSVDEPAVFQHLAAHVLEGGKLPAPLEHFAPSSLAHALP
jgi:hypothetical protein